MARNDAFETELPALYAHRLRAYFQTRADPGDFLRAVLANDLIASVHCGAVTDVNSLGVLTQFLMRHRDQLPTFSFGGWPQVGEWLRSEGSMRPDVAARLPRF